MAVRLRSLRKVYKLYRNPAYRLRDILGLLPADKRYYDEHVALHDVTLDIRRGEKVAIIGRNGAGKSTLLRLITKVIEPTPAPSRSRVRPRRCCPSARASTPSSRAARTLRPISRTSGLPERKRSG